MSSIVSSDNIKNCLTTAFYIPPKKGHNYINIKDIQIVNELNTVDYKTNYIACLRPAHVGPHDLSIFAYSDNNSNMNYYLLTLVRIPIRQYKNKYEIIEQLNKSYSMSIYNCLLNGYMIKTMLNTGSNLFSIYSSIKNQIFYYTTDKYNIIIEDNASLNRNNKTIMIGSGSYTTNIRGVDRLLKLEEYGYIHISYTDTKFNKTFFDLMYSNNSFNISSTNEDNNTKLSNFFKDKALYSFVSHFTEYNNSYSFYFYNIPDTKVIETTKITIRPKQEDDTPGKTPEDNGYTEIIVNDDVTSIINYKLQKMPFNPDNDVLYYNIVSESTHEGDTYTTTTTKYSYTGKVIRLSINVDNDYIEVSDEYDYNGFVYSNTHTNIINFSFGFDKSYYNSIKTTDFIDRTIVEQLSFIKEYTDEKIVFDFEVLPVDVEFSSVVNINSPYNDVEKSLEYNTIVKLPQLYCKNNKIYSLSDDLLVGDDIKTNSFYSSFNVNAFNIMNYIYIPENKIKVTTKNIFSVNNKFVNIIEGNFMTSYIYNSDQIFNYNANDFINIDDIDIKKTYYIQKTQAFPDHEKMNICYIYNDNIDMILNNNDINADIIFNIIDTIDYDKNNNTINVNKNVKLSNNGVYIYLTGKQYFQWPLINNKGTIKYNYI